MKRKLYARLSAATLIAGAVFGGYALVRTYLVRAALPPGTCPVVHYSPFIYTAIALCAVSFVLTLLEQRVKKRDKQTEST